MGFRRNSPPKRGRALFFTVALAVVAGFVWAMIETGRSPADLLRLFSSASPETGIPSSGDARTPRPPAEPKPKPEPTTVIPPPVEPKPEPKPEVRPRYSAAEMASLFREVDGHLLLGRILEADARLTAFDPASAPETDAPRLKEFRKRLQAHRALLRETYPGTTIDVPEMWRLQPRGGNRIVVKSLVQRGDDYAFETTTGIRSRVSRTSVKTLEPLKPYEARAEINLELENQCRSRGIEAKQERTEIGFRYVFLAPPRSKVDGVVFFDLADFCARNGANERLPELFDEGLRLDPDLVASVHEMKADRMVDVLLYFISIRSAADAEFTARLLSERYADTRAYRTRIDKNVQEAYQVLFRKPFEIASVTSGPPKTSGSEPPVQAKPDPPPAQPLREPVPPEPAPVSGALPLPESAPAEAKRRCAKADAHFAKAVEHIRNSDPNMNRGGWAVENRKALDFLLLARDDYNAAQEEFERAGKSIPPELLDRFRETMMRASMCRKRAVSTK